MPVLNLLSGFVDFKNTKEGRRVDEEGIPSLALKFLRVRKVNGKGYDVKICLNRSLLLDMKKNGITRFKFMFDEKSTNVALVYCTLDTAYDISDYKTRKNGSIEVIDKYVTAVMAKVLESKNATSITYKAKLLKEHSAYLCTMGKIVKVKD